MGHEPPAAALQSTIQPAIIRPLGRNHLLLRMLETLGWLVGGTVLYCQEPAPGQAYKVVRCRFGAISVTTYADRRTVVDDGLLISEHSWTSTGVRRDAERETIPDPRARAFTLLHPTATDHVAAA